jgi:hypothetical protein
MGKWFDADPALPFKIDVQLLEDGRAWGER